MKSSGEALSAARSASSPSVRSGGALAGAAATSPTSSATSSRHMAAAADGCPQPPPATGRPPPPASSVSSSSSFISCCCSSPPRLRRVPGRLRGPMRGRSVAPPPETVAPSKPQSITATRWPRRGRARAARQLATPPPTHWEERGAVARVPAGTGGDVSRMGGNGRGGGHPLQRRQPAEPPASASAGRAA